MSQSKKLALGIIPFSNSRVDRANRRIYGANAMAVGEARGHGLWADTKTLHMMADLANNRQYPVMMRFGHPGMSENAFGKKLSKAYKFRVEDAKLKHDIQFQEWASLSPTFSQDPVAYIMNRTETDPASFGESVVLTYEEWWVLDDGSEVELWTEKEDGDGDGKWQYNERPQNSLYDLPVMRPVKFHFVDFVGDGALTPDGMFSEDALVWKNILEDTSSEYAMEAFSLIRRFQAKYKISANELHLKINELMGKYTQWEGFQMPDELEQVTPVAEESGVESPDIPVTEDLLAEAMAEAAELAVDIEDPVEAESDASETTADLSNYVPRAEFEAMQARVVQLQQALQNQSVQLAEYLKIINGTVRNMKQQIADINSEDVVTGVVGASPFAGANQFSTPTPGGNIRVPVAMDAKHADNIAHAQQGTTEPVTVPDDPFSQALAGQPGLMTVNNQ